MNFEIFFARIPDKQSNNSSNNWRRLWVQMTACFNTFSPNWDMKSQNSEHHSGNSLTVSTWEWCPLQSLNGIGPVRLQADVPQNPVVALFGVRPYTICKVRAKSHMMWEVRNRQQNQEPKETEPQEVRPLSLSAFKNHRHSSTDPELRFAGQYAQQLSTQTIQNRLHDGLFTLVSATQVLEPEHVKKSYIYMSRLFLQHSYHRIKMWRRRRECFGGCSTV